MDRPSLLALAAAQNGVFTRAQALASGVSPDEGRRNLRDGVWVALRRGVYVETDSWARADEQRRNVLRLQAVALKADPPCVGSHTTAAALLGIELWEPSYDVVNVTRPSCSGRREAGVWHHEATLPAEEVVESSGLLVTSVLRTAHDVARSGIDHEHAVVAMDSALRMSGGTYDQRAAALDELVLMHLGRTDWHGSRIAGGAVAFADPRSGSPGDPVRACRSPDWTCRRR